MKRDTKSRLIQWSENDLALIEFCLRGDRPVVIRLYGDGTLKRLVRQVKLMQRQHDQLKSAAMSKGRDMRSFSSFTSLFTGEK